MFFFENIQSSYLVYNQTSDYYNYNNIMHTSQCLIVMHWCMDGGVAKVEGSSQRLLCHTCCSGFVPASCTH